MKNFEGFRASVYARAEARRAEIRERNRKIRGAALSAAMIALVMAVMVPVVRNANIFSPKGTTTAPPFIETQNHDNTAAREPREAPPARRVLLMGTPDGGAAEVVVLDSDAKQKAFVEKYKLPTEEALSFTPVLDSAVETLHSTEELEAFLQSLPKTSDSMQQVISEYDEEFFASNDLYAMPIDIVPAGIGVEETLPVVTETETEPVTETGPVPETETTVPAETTMEADMEPSRPPPPSKPTDEPLGENDVQVLLLVPTNKTQREATTEIPS